MSRWNKEPRLNEDGQLVYGQYWDSGGGLVILREALGIDHPEHLYNYIKRAGLTPEHYGIKHPVEEAAEQEYGHMSREELVQLCMNQRRELEACYRAGY